MRHSSLEELLRRQDRLARFGRRLACETRLEPLIEIVAEEVRQQLDADRCTVFIVDHKRKQLWSKLAHGVEEEVLRVPIDRGVAGFVAKTGSSANIKDAYADKRFSPELDKATGYRTRSILAIPLKDRAGKVIGVFQVLNKKDGEFHEDDEGLLGMLAMIAGAAIENATLYEDLKRSHLETVYRMAMVAEYRDQEDTAKHLRHISRYSSIVAESFGLPYQMVEDIRYASPLHDIGKVAIPDNVLRKPGRLTEEEYELMKKHPEYGAKVLERAESRLLQLAHRISLAHHEKWDGTGYPYGLKGDAIPLEACIVSVVDVFDALMTKRVYKAAWPLEDTVRYLREQSGKHFHPGVVDAFMKGFPAIQEALNDEIQKDADLQNGHNGHLK
jgi:HD-GYP domain-containing protein (c-di-GMP phosphodiesterase class II)